MDFTQEQEMILLLVGWVTLMAGFIIFNLKDDDQKTTIRAFYNNKLEWTCNKNQDHEEKTSKKKK